MTSVREEKWVLLWGGSCVHRYQERGRRSLPLKKKKRTYEVVVGGDGINKEVMNLDNRKRKRL